MTNFKKVKISEIFDIYWEQSNLTKTFIEKNRGAFPVYSWETKNSNAYWYLDSYKFEKKLLLWTTYWDAWSLKIVEWKFNIWRNASWLWIKDKFIENIYLDYIKSIAEIYFKIKAQWDKWTLRKLSQTRVKNIKIKIPINKYWEFDLEKQKEIAEKYKKIEKIKNKIKLIKEDLEEKVIKFEFGWKSKKVSIKDIFELWRGKSIYTREYWNNNKWEFPVYSAWKEKLTSINTFDFDWEYLTWATNWFAGYLKRLNWKFSLNADRWIFLPKTKEINIDFINYSLAIDLRNLTKWRMWDKWKNEFTKLSPKKIEDNIFIEIPIKNNWKFDLEKQKEVAKKYEKIEKIKTNLIEELEYLEKIKIDI